MDVDLRPVKKLRESAAARSALGPIIEAVCASPADLSRLRVVCDWIQYRSNFREAVVARPIGGTDVELATVACFERAEVCDDVTARIEGENAPGNVGVDRAGSLIDQRQVAVAGADLAGA